MQSKIDYVYSIFGCGCAAATPRYTSGYILAGTQTYRAAVEQCSDVNLPLQGLSLIFPEWQIFRSIDKQYSSASNAFVGLLMQKISARSYNACKTNRLFRSLTFDFSFITPASFQRKRWPNGWVIMSSGSSKMYDPGFQDCKQNAPPELMPFYYSVSLNSRLIDRIYRCSTAEFVHGH